jgi:hypothetical protein
MIAVQTGLPASINVIADRLLEANRRNDVHKQALGIEASLLRDKRRAGSALAAQESSF